MATTDSANSFNSSLFYVSELDNKRDPVRSTKWRLIIPGNILTVIGNYKLSNGKDSSTDLGVFSSSTVERFPFSSSTVYFCRISIFTGGCVIVASS